jgi:hypothetical protein
MPTKPAVIHQTLVLVTVDAIVDLGNYSCAVRAQSSSAISPPVRALLTSSAMFAVRVPPPVSSATRSRRNGVSALP